MEFSVKRNGEKDVVMSVKDSGQGIPKDELAHVFDRFYQAKQNKSGGTLNHIRFTKSRGIGLKIHSVLPRRKSLRKRLPLTT